MPGAGLIQGLEIEVTQVLVLPQAEKTSQPIVIRHREERRGIPELKFTWAHGTELLLALCPDPHPCGSRESKFV